MTRQKAICILGMHRSGTSAIARAINLLGAYIGREDQLMPAREDNPDGFWENMVIYSFHERFLKSLFRSWDSVWPMPDGWWTKPEVKPYRQELIGLIRREFEGQPLWMWKDPRTSFLLPLWKEVLQELEIDVSYLLCVRNPLDVAASLKRREEFSRFKSLTLWHLHNTSACYWTENCSRVVVHYDDFLEDWEPGLKKIAAAMDIPWPQDDSGLRSTLADFLKLSSRHSHSDLSQLTEDRTIPGAVVSLCRFLMETQKNPGLLDSEESKEYITKSYTGYSTLFTMMYSEEWGIIETTNTSIQNTHIANLERHIGNLEAVVRDKETHIANLERHIDNLEAVVRDKETHIANLERHIGNLEAVVRDNKTHIANLALHTEKLEKGIERMGGTLNFIYHSYGLGALWACNKMVDNLFPHNTRRRLSANIFINTIKNPMATLKSLNKKNIKLFIQYLKKAEPAILEERAETLIFKQAILMYCDKVSLEPENVEIAGWAISSKGIEKLEVYCDNKLLGQASYGFSRPDVHAVYPFVADSVNSGFRFSMLLEKTLSAGPHTLLIKVLANDGQNVETVYSMDVADAYLKYLTRTIPTESALRWMREASKEFPGKPHITLALAVKEETLPFLNRTLESIKAQSYPSWDIQLFHEKDFIKDISGDLKALRDERKLDIYPITDSVKSISEARGDFICFLSSGDLLAPHALFEMVKRLNVDETLDLIYSDEDTLVDGQRKDFFFKPDWSPDLLLSMNYIGQFFLIRKELFTQIGSLDYGFSREGMYDLLLRVTERTTKLGHVPLVLYTKGDPSEYSPETGKRIIEDSLRRRGIKGDVTLLRRKGTYRVKRDIISNPKVSIIIPTAYKKPELLRKCLKSVAEKSTYTNYEVVLIDHSRGKLAEGEVKELFSTPVLRVAKYKGEFNFSRMNNLTAKEATGDYLIFLNDDTEVISPEWIEAMLEHAQRTEVGVVGGKLLYPDDTIQHAGVFLVDSFGIARHAFRFLPNGSESYRGFADVIRNCSAVTFACVMVSKEMFTKLGGLDENLKIEWNDIDFCLRASEAGYLVVWTPFCLLYHAELSSREAINVEEDKAYFVKRWRPLLKQGDRYYNPNLRVNSDDFSINARPETFRNAVAYESVIKKKEDRRHAKGERAEEDIVIESDSDVSIIIPTFNGAKDLTVMLPNLMKQNGLTSIEIVAIDSGSGDGSVDICRANGAKVIEISQETFSHSYARNLGAESATKKYLLFMVQDALPSSELFIYHMLRCLKQHGAIAASCGEFLRMDADLFAEVQQWGHYRFLGMDSDDKVLSLPGKADDYVSLRKSAQLTDIACLIERNVFLRYRYRNDYAEDLDLGLRLIRDKQSLVYMNTAKVIHSHVRSPSYILKRSFVDNSALSKLFPDFLGPEVDREMFCEDIVFMYGLIETVSERLTRLQTPCERYAVRKMVMDCLDEGFGNRYPKRSPIEDTPYVDNNFITFIKTINNQYDPQSDKVNYRGKLLADVIGRVNMAFDYLQDRSETIDDYRKQDIMSCLYKILAIAIGTELAFYNCNENPRKTEFVAHLKNELARGV